jgi:hypothetical protein
MTQHLHERGLERGLTDSRQEKSRYFSGLSRKLAEREAGNAFPRHS